MMIVGGGGQPISFLFGLQKSLYGTSTERYASASRFSDEVVVPFAMPSLNIDSRSSSFGNH
jgi:hypothetical protein